MDIPEEELLERIRQISHAQRDGGLIRYLLALGFLKANERKIGNAWQSGREERSILGLS